MNDLTAVSDRDDALAWLGRLLAWEARLDEIRAGSSAAPPAADMAPSAA